MTSDENMDGVLHANAERGARANKGRVPQSQAMTEAKARLAALVTGRR
jgi:hypothetical protein